MNNKKRSGIYVLCLLLILIIGISYAWLQITLTGDKKNTVTVGTLSLKLDDKFGEGINIENAVPLSDESGLKTKSYKFELENNGTILSNYTIYLDDLDLEEGEVRLPDKYVKYTLIKNGKESSPALLSTTGTNPNRILDSGKLKVGEKNTYELKIWIDSSADNSIMAMTFLTKIRVEASQEGIENDNPIKRDDINIEDGKTTKIDIGNKDPNDFTFKSDDPDVADVDKDGNVIPKGPGTTDIIIKNKKTGEEETVTIKVTKKIKVTYVDNENIESIEKATDSCVLDKKGQTSCDLILPEIKARDGYTVIGWNKDVNAITGKKIGSKVSVSEDTTFYAIVVKNKVKYKATFKKNGEGVESIGSEELTCDTLGESCSIEMPSIKVKEGYEVVGWSTNSDATETDIKVGMKVEINSDTIYYAITKKKAITYKVTFKRNGAQTLDGLAEDTVEKTCTIPEAFNDKKQATSCKITTPSIVGNINTPIVVGFASDKNSKDKEISANEEIEISKDATYYAITKSAEKTYKATFVKEGNGVISIDNQTENIIKGCKIAETYNGEEQASSCNVTPPSIETELSYTAHGWNSIKDSKTALDNISLNKDTVYYPVVTKNAITYKVNFYRNGAKTLDGSDEDTVERTCTIPEVSNSEEQATSCKVTVPTIVGSDNTPTVLGYAKDKNATIADKGSEIDISSDEKYYAITMKDSEDVYINYKINGAASYTVDGAEKTEDFELFVCKTKVAYNGQPQEGCDVTIANIVGNSNTPKVSGWSSSATDHDNIKYKTNEKTALTKTVDLYAQTTNDKITYKINSYNAGKNVSSINDDNAKKSCTIKQTYNGEEQAKNCEISGADLPEVTAKKGYTYAGWTKDGATSTSGSSVITLTKENDAKDWYSYAIGNSFTVEYYVENKLNQKETYQVSDGIELKTIEKQGYSFKGWDTSSDASTAVYKKGQKASITAEEGDVVKLYAVFVDDIVPVCSFGTAPTTTVQNNTQIELTCTDQGSKIKSSELNKDNFTVSDSNYGEIVDVSSPVEINDGYKYVITVKGLSSGTTINDSGKFTISLNEKSVLDNSNNGNSKITSYEITINGRKYTATFTKNGKGVESITSTSISCTTTGTDTTCKIITPEVITANGWNFEGWNEDKTAHTGIKSSTEIELSSDQTYYTIAYKNEKKVTTVFYLNGAKSQDGDTSEKLTRTCTIPEIWNADEEQTTCSIRIPTIVGNDNTPYVLGYAKKADEINTDNMISHNNDNYPVSESNDYYAITRSDETAEDKELVASFVKNGLGIESIAEERLTCTIKRTYNGKEEDKSCTIKMPTMQVKEGYTGVGYSTDKTMQDEERVIKPETNISISSDITYYSIVKKDKVNATAAFYLNGAKSQDGDTSDKIEKTCTIPEAWNDEKQGTQCEITTPTVEGSDNTPIVLGYAVGDSDTNKNTTVASIASNSKIMISNGDKYSAITTNEGKTYKATFHLNGADAIINNGAEVKEENVEKSCNILQTWNGQPQESCKVTTPGIKANDNTPIVRGWQDNETNKMYGVDEEISLTKTSTDLYAKTTNNEITYRVSSFEAGVGVDSISSTSAVSCTIEKTEDGQPQNKTCKITKDKLPEVTLKNGYTSVGWSTKKGDTSGAEEITLSENVDTYYANATANSYTIEYYSESKSFGVSSHKVDDVPFNLKSISSLNLEKAGYTFKGWSVENNDVVTYTNGQSITTNLATTAGSIVKLYAVWKDETAPVCSFGSSPTLHTGETGELTLTCTDNGSGIANSNLAVSSFSTTANGKVTAVSAPTIVDNEYQYIVTVQGTKVGNFIVTLNEGAVVDASGNKNIATSSNDVIVNGITYKASFTKNGNGISSIGNTTLSCTTEGDSLTCEVELPSIVMENPNNYSVCGWSTNSETKTCEDATKVGEMVTLSTDNQVFYTVTKKNEVALTANFNANGATLACTASDDATCENNDDLYVTTCKLKEAYNLDVQDTECVINTPTITRSDFEIIGYNTDKNSNTSLLSSASALILNNENKGQTYYAITKKDVEITWNANDHTIGSTKSACTILNTNKTCTITTPTIEKEGYVILGWYDQSGNKFAGPGVNKEVSENAEYTATSRAPDSTEVSYDSTNSNLTDASGNKCTDIQCAIDALARITSN